MQKNEIILYQPEGNITIEVRVEDETVWLSLDLMAELFQRDKSTISRHIKNIFSEGELRRDSGGCVKSDTPSFFCKKKP